jgi:integrase
MCRLTRRAERHSTFWPRRKRGEPLRAIATSGLTLAEAHGQFDAALRKRGRSGHTLAAYKRHIELLPAEWRHKQLAELAKDPGAVAGLHERITRERGHATANAAMRVIRATYNFARRGDRSLPPEPPTIAVEMNLETRRDTAIPFHAFPAWARQVEELRKTSPIRASFHTLTLLTGSRPSALKIARWRHLDLRKRTWDFPRTKTGSLTIPLSIEMVQELRRVRDAGRILHEGSEFIFPGNGPDGHLVEHKQRRTVLSHWAGDLRQTHRTVAAAIGIDELSSRLLLGHSLAGVSQGYVTRAALVGTSLRDAQRRISRKVSALMMSKEGPATYSG